MNSREVNRFNVATPRPARTADGRHVRSWLSGFDSHTIRQFQGNPFAGRTRVCKVQVLSPSTNRAKKQELRMTLDGTDPSFNDGADGKSLGHIIAERQIYYFSPDVLRKAKFGNTTAQTEQIRLIVLEMTH
jgi:hypothetical protein